ncbi:MAG: BsuBI/PstI family type II restriction endonuclease, partial [Gaiellaceae bacterium]
SRGQLALRAFLVTHGIQWERWYADNSREPIRDEIIRPLNERYGAVLRRRGVAASDASPALTLADDFAALFDADIDETEFETRAERWRSDHLGAGEQARLDALRKLDEHTDSVVVSLPGRGDRHLPPGSSSAITAKVISELGPRLLQKPYPLAICHSRDPVAAEDARELDKVGLSLDRDLALPDVMLIDAADGTFWFIEVVVTGGPIHEGRRADLLAWATARGVSPDRCQFVTAYRSRSDRVFRETVGELAWNSLAWFADEPARVFRLDELDRR